MKIIPIIILSLFLQGCAFLEKNKTPSITADTIVRLNEEVLTPCATLNENVVITSFDDILQQYANISTAYGVCATKQNTSIKLLKEFSNK